MIHKKTYLGIVKKEAQVISPTARGALFSARTTPQPSQNLLVEPSWNPRGALPQGRPGPPRSLFGLRPRSFQLLGEKTFEGHAHSSNTCFYIFPNNTVCQGGVSRITKLEQHRLFPEPCCGKKVTKDKTLLWTANTGHKEGYSAGQRTYKSNVQELAGPNQLR